MMIAGLKQPDLRSHSEISTLQNVSNARSKVELAVLARNIASNSNLFCGLLCPGVSSACRARLGHKFKGVDARFPRRG